MRGTSIPARTAGTVPGLVRALGFREGVVALVPLDALTAAQATTQANTVLLKASSAAQSFAGAAGEVRPVGDRRPRHRRRDRRRAARRRRRPGARGVRLRRLPRRHGPRGRADPARPAAPPRHDPPPARTQLVIRLRTLGLPHGGERRLAWAEVMPLLVVGVLAGVVVGVFAPVAVSAALDLAPFTGAAARLSLEPRPLAGLLAGGGVLVLGALALLTDAVSARHGDLAQHLRRGDSA